MPSVSNVQLTANLAFPIAGVAFAIEVRSPESGSDGQAPSFHLSATEIPGGRAVPMTVAASPQLADWVRGYSRWLVRARVTASHDQNGVTGVFAGGLTPEEVLRGVRDACDMVRQRFEVYRESILA